MEKPLGILGSNHVTQYLLPEQPQGISVGRISEVPTWMWAKVLPIQDHKWLKDGEQFAQFSLPMVCYYHYEMQTVAKTSLATRKRSGGFWVTHKFLDVMLDLPHTQLLALVAWLVRWHSPSPQRDLILSWFALGSGYAWKLVIFIVKY